MTNATLEEASKKKLHRSERREAILRGAARAFVENGYEATSLDDVAQTAGISRALLYRHFATKKELYLAVIANFRRALPGKPAASQTFDAGVLDELIAAAQADPDGFRLCFRHAVREPDFRDYFERMAVRRAYYIEANLKDSIKSPKRRRFAGSLIQELVINTLLTWIDNGLPDPAMMPTILRRIIKAVMSSMEDD